MKIPDVLIYNPRGTNLYSMVNTKENKVIGRMIAYPTINHDLYISELTILRNKREGFGTKFLDFAKLLRDELGCEGKVVLDASTTPYDPHNPPHIFYRKNGFTSDDKKMLKKIDKYIKKGKQLDYQSTPVTRMYYPPDTPPAKSNFLQLLKNLFQIIKL